jgi:hypothetical protein
MFLPSTGFRCGTFCAKEAGFTSVGVQSLLDLRDDVVAGLDFNLVEPYFRVAVIAQEAGQLAHEGLVN